MSSSSSLEYISADEAPQFAASSQESSQESGMSMEHLGLEPYNFEPLESEAEENLASSTSSGDSASSSQTDSRIDNTSWCQCGNCRTMQREWDCICCAEMKALTSFPIPVLRYSCFFPVFGNEKITEVTKFG